MKTVIGFPGKVKRYSKQSVKKRMKNKMELKDKKISVVGLGKSGIALAEVLYQKGARLLVSDNRTEEQLKDVREKFSGLDIEWETGGHSERIYKGRDLVIISPGVSVFNPVIQSAIKEGVKVIGEVEMAYFLSKAPFIAVTGTNGKSTTTKLIHETLITDGRKSTLAGNIGIPLVEVIQDVPQDGWVTSEISSFQLETVEYFSPHVAVLLNITSDHIDRHGSFEEYKNAKANLFRLQSPSDFAVLNADDPAVMSLVPRIPSRKLFFSRKREVEEGAFITNGFIKIKFDGRERVLFSKDMIPLKGNHNLENIMAVVCVCQALGIKPEILIKTLQNFQLPQYRLAFVEKIDGVSFYNDSKGTNPDAVRAGLESFPEKPVLIAGGSDKNMDFLPLAEAIKKYSRFVVLIGQSALRIKSACEKVGFINTAVIDDLSLEGFRQAILTAYEKAKPGGIVLLSPSCASFDMFRNAEHRGHVFDQFVRGLNHGDKKTD